MPPSAATSAKEEALIQQALAELRRGKRPELPPRDSASAPNPASASNPPSTAPAAPVLSPSAAPRALRSMPTGVVDTKAPAAKHTVFAPAGMTAEMQARIALLMEQEAEERERTRQRQKRLVIATAATVVGVVALAFLFSLRK